MSEKYGLHNYTEQLKSIPWLRTPFVPEGYKHGWQSYVTFIDESISPKKA